MFRAATAHGRVARARRRASRRRFSAGARIRVRCVGNTGAGCVYTKCPVHEPKQPPVYKNPGSWNTIHPIPAPSRPPYQITGVLRIKGGATATDTPPRTVGVLPLKGGTLPPAEAPGGTGEPRKVIRSTPAGTDGGQPASGSNGASNHKVVGSHHK